MRLADFVHTTKMVQHLSSADDLFVGVNVDREATTEDLIQHQFHVDSPPSFNVYFVNSYVYGVAVARLIER